MFFSKIPLIIVLLFSSLTAFSQYTGGVGDGYAMGEFANFNVNNESIHPKIETQLYWEGEVLKAKEEVFNKSNSYVLLDVMGQELRRQKVLNLNRNDWPKGIYLLVIQQAEYTRTEKILF